MSEPVSKAVETPHKREAYTPPKGASSEHQLVLGGRSLAYRAEADWIVLRKKERPVAEVFHVAYMRSGPGVGERPVTFVFNGGPGAASAYLHVGALGPRRVAFDMQGGVLPPPARLVDNTESWLDFTDLVFVDPIGTGLSRAIEDDAPAGKPGGDGKEPEKTDEKEFYQLGRDLDSLGEFIQRFLSRHKRWSSPVIVAGESYGGFRVGKLARRLQEGFGVGLNAAILISPALELAFLTPSDYDILHWSDAFPSMAAAAFHHGRGTANPRDASLDKVIADAEAFATTELVTYLTQGDGMPEERRRQIRARIAAYLGLVEERIESCSGRISPGLFCRELLRETRLVCGLYDASLTAVDPFPDRDLREGPDPTLFSIERVFTGGINTHIRADLGLETERDYRLLSMDVNRAWKIDTQQHAFDRPAGATDDLRYAMALNPHMRVMIVHGLYDLVTPYFTSKRIVDHMKLTDAQRAMLSFETFRGGHMFYTWQASRIAFTKAARDLTAHAVGTL